MGRRGGGIQLYDSLVDVAEGREYSQVMPRDLSGKTLCRKDPLRYGLQGPREHQQMVTTLSKEGLGSCAYRSKPIVLAENLFPTRFSCQPKSPW